MSHKKIRPFIVKVSVLGYFPLYQFKKNNLRQLRDSVNNNVNVN